MANMEEVLNNNLISINYLNAISSILNDCIKDYSLENISNLINLIDNTYQITITIFNSLIKENKNINLLIINKTLFMIKDMINIIIKINNCLMSYVVQRPLPNFFRIYQIFYEYIINLNNIVFDAFYDNTREYTLNSYESQLKLIIDEINSTVHSLL
jgi:hypothetical protein